MTPNDRLRMAQALRDNHENLRMKKLRLLAQLGEVERTETRVEDEFQRAFPDLDFGVPSSTWEDLTATEQVVTHFLAKHGHVRRVLDVLPEFRNWARRDISEIGFRMHLSRLRAKHVVERGYLGWSVATPLLAKALSPPVVPKMPQRTGMEGIRQRARVVKGEGEGPAGVKPLDLAALLPVPDPTPGDVYAHIPLDAPINLVALLMAVEGEMSGPGLGRVRKCIDALLSQQLVVRAGRETYARRGVVEELGPTPMLERVWRHIPTQKAIGIGALAVLVEGDAGERARRATLMRIQRLMTAGWVERVGRGLYTRKARGATVNVDGVELGERVKGFLERMRAG